MLLKIISEDLWICNSTHVPSLVLPIKLTSNTHTQHTSRESLFGPTFNHNGLVVKRRCNFNTFSSQKCRTKRRMVYIFLIFDFFLYIYIYCRKCNAAFNTLIKQWVIVLGISKNDAEHTHLCQQCCLYLDIFLFSLIKS